MANSDHSVHVALTFDGRFAPLAGVTASSVLSHSTEDICFHFVHSGCVGEDIEFLDRVVDSGGGRSHFYHVDADSLARLPINKHASAANYYRLMLADILPKHIERVIYLDCDVIVRASLSALYAVPLCGFALGVVPEPSEANVERLGLAPGTPYLNSGVLILDLNQWRSRGIGQALAKLVATASVPIEFWDQDAIAMFFRGEWCSLPPEWNVTHRYFFGRDRPPLPCDDPKIVHFSGDGLKPWNHQLFHPYESEFWGNVAAAEQHGLHVPRPPANPRRGSRQLLKVVAKKLIDMALCNQFVWNTRIGSYVNWRVNQNRAQDRFRNQEISQDRSKQEELEFLTDRVPDLSVQRGPFKGLRYPGAWSHGSSLLPKIFGTYECELHPLLERLLVRQYDVIIDVGAAEGYYAVGAAQAWPSAKIFAFERQEAPRKFLGEMARINGVAERLDIRCEFFLTDLRSIMPAYRGLLICDAEGAENEIFADGPLLHLLENFDLLLEAHDFIIPGIAAELKRRLSRTHSVKDIFSVDDGFRPDLVEVPELTGLSNDDRVRRLAERRPAAMKWLYAEPNGGEASTTVDRKFSTKAISIRSEQAVS